MSKLVGWNIFLEYKDEDGTLRLEAWDISDFISTMLDEDFNKMKEEEE